MTGAARTDPAAPLRGPAAGLLTAALAVAAHGVASGTPPAGAVAIQFALLAATVGALASTIRRADDARVLLALLGTGQFLGHVMLSAAGHDHAPTAPMVAAHLAAVAAGAVLIAASDRLCAALSRAVRVVAWMACPTVAPPSAVAPRSADQPRHSARLLAASVSHRGPPVSHIR